MSAKIVLIDKSNLKNLNIFHESNNIIIPMDLESQIYLINNKIIFQNPLDFLDNNFHKQTIKVTDDILLSISFKSDIFLSVNEDILSNIRFNIYFFYYLKFILDHLLKKYDSYMIVLEHGNFTVSNYLSNFIYCFKNYSSKILFEGNFNYSSKKINFYSYTFYSKINFNQKSVLLNNLGYNFKRLLFYFKLNGFQIFYVDNQKNFFVNLMNKFSFLKSINFKQSLIKNNKINELQIDFQKIDDEFLKIFLKNNYNKLNNKLINDHNYCKSFEKFITQIPNIKFMISNINKGKDGILSQISKKMNSKSIIISHGTLVSSFDQYDKIYKRIIANQVFSKEFDYAFSQSKLSDLFFNEYNAKNHYISGNILFSYQGKIKIHKKNQLRILYAVTQKNINNIQVYGCEMYYEFLDNLKFLNTIALDKSLKIFIKLHPSIIDNAHSLSKIYSNLIFVNRKIHLILKNIDITCSFSSSVIEDSLNMKIPVVLLDRWKRYRHTISQNFPYIENHPILYANDKKQFLLALEIAKKINQFDFDKCIYSSHYYKNIKKSISKIV